MDSARISRRALMLSAGALAAWHASPVRALMQGAARETEALPQRVAALIGRMTVEEKAGQLTLMPAAWDANAATFNPSQPLTSFRAQLQQIRAGHLTGVFNGSGAGWVREAQTAAIKQSRLGIPLIFAADVIHGFRTVFPVPLAESASFDPQLAERTARVAAIEAAASGIDWTFAPMVDIARDARWGRGVEGAGEDILLGMHMAEARVKGFQGSSLTADDAVLACAKHFVAYGAAEAGLDYNTVDISERTLREIYFPPFQAAFAAGALSTMASFNELSGVPATANPWLLDQVLRREWNFGGLVVTDYTGDEELIAHGFAADAREATRLAFMAGVDMSMTSGLFLKHLPDLVTKGEVPMARLDEAVRRVLAVKVKLGLFDDPFRRIDVQRERTRTRTAAHQALAREAARRSIVMLKNEGDLLPLPRSGKRIALIGPFAEGRLDLLGPWSIFGRNTDAVDLASGVRAAVADASHVSVTLGSLIEKSLPDGIEEAVAAARAADIVVLAIGESQKMSGEAESRTDISLPRAQQELAEAIAATGKPMVVLLKNGRALALDGAVLNAPAILVTWFLGSETGTAIADVLFGDEGPSARLPVSFPHASGQAPYYYAHKPTGRPNRTTEIEAYKTRFRDLPHTACFAFGHGLTYGRIEYSDLALSATTLSWNGTLTVRTTLTNSGSREAVEVAQLYIRDVAASITRPVRELKAYQRVSLAPGESKQVTFTLSRRDLMFVGVDLRPTVEPGEFHIWVAPSAEAEGVSDRFVLSSDQS
jgi:beta-glucosidase